MRIAVLTPPRAKKGRNVSAEADEVSACLDRLGQENFPAIYHASRDKTEKQLDKIAPEVVFNLVDEVPEGPDKRYLVTQSLERLRLRYTGVQSAALEAVCDKPRMRETLIEGALPVAPDLEHGEETTRFIVKPAVDHASPDAPKPGVVTGRHAAETMISERTKTFGGRWFAETYIDGREFNLFVIETVNGPLALPPTEIHFGERQDGTPNIVGYDETWSDGTENGQPIASAVSEADQPLLAELERLALAAWRLFAITGYARVDFRVDAASRPYIFEINPNPSLVASAGLCAAAGRAGMSQTDVIAHVLAAATT